MDQAIGLLRGSYDVLESSDAYLEYLGMYLNSMEPPPVTVHRTACRNLLKVLQFIYITAMTLQACSPNCYPFENARVAIYVRTLTLSFTPRRNAPLSRRLCLPRIPFLPVRPPSTPELRDLKNKTSATPYYSAPLLRVFAPRDGFHLRRLIVR